MKLSMSFKLWRVLLLFLPLVSIRCTLCVCVCVCVCVHQMPTVILVYLLQSKMHGSVAVAAFINLSCKAQAARLSQSLTPFFLLPPSISQSKSQ